MNEIVGRLAIISNLIYCANCPLLEGNSCAKELASLSPRKYAIVRLRSKLPGNISHLLIIIYIYIILLNWSVVLLCLRFNDCFVFPTYFINSKQGFWCLMGYHFKNMRCQGHIVCTSVWWPYLILFALSDNLLALNHLYSLFIYSWKCWGWELCSLSFTTLLWYIVSVPCGIFYRRCMPWKPVSISISQWVYL